MISAIELSGALGDVVYLAITAGFFAVAQLLVRACDRLAGPNPADATPAGESAPTSTDPALAEVAR